MRVNDTCAKATGQDEHVQDVTWLDSGENIAAARFVIKQGIALVVYDATGQPVIVDGFMVRKQLCVRVTMADRNTEFREY